MQKCPSKVSLNVLPLDKNVDHGKKRIPWEPGWESARQRSHGSRPAGAAAPRWFEIEEKFEKLPRKFGK